MISARGARVGCVEGSFLGVIPVMENELLAGGGFDFTGRTDERSLMVLSGVVVICGTDIYEMTKWNGRSGKVGRRSRRIVGIYVLRAHDTNDYDYSLRNTASTTSSDLLLPPRSGVSTRPSLMT